jgi:acyl-coenzyme A thioesterase PaaI-like protein
MSDPLGWARMLDWLRDVVPGSRRAEQHRLGHALRELLHVAVRTAAPIEAISRTAEATEALVTDLRSFPSETEYQGYAEAANAGGVGDFFDRSPMLGSSNPIAPPLDLWEEDGRIRGRAIFGPAFEGPPGCVHGGFVAAAFDELLGSVQSLSGAPGMTASLTIQYKSPTPLEAELRFDGAIDSIEGRKIRCSGSLYEGDRLCATAEGLFISIDPSKFVAWRDERAERIARGND